MHCLSFSPRNGLDLIAHSYEIFRSYWNRFKDTSIKILVLTLITKEIHLVRKARNKFIALHIKLKTWLLLFFYVNKNIIHWYSPSFTKRTKLFLVVNNNNIYWKYSQYNWELSNTPFTISRFITSLQSYWRLHSKIIYCEYYKSASIRSGLSNYYISHGTRYIDSKRNIYSKTNIGQESSVELNAEKHLSKFKNYGL